MSHWMSHVGPNPETFDHRRFAKFEWYDLPEDKLMERIAKENQAYEDHYPCDDQCGSWLDELCAMAARYEEIAPGKAPWLKAEDN